jgi:hypothetical protein
MTTVTGAMSLWARIVSTLAWARIFSLSARSFSARLIASAM